MHTNNEMSIVENQQYLTVRQFAQQFPAFPEGGLRHLIFHENSNGFKAAILRVGRKVLINVPAFFSWLEAQNQAVK